MSRLLFFIISLAPKGLLFHLWHFYYFTYFYQHPLLLLLPLSHYYLHYFYPKLLLLLFISKTIISIICFRVYYYNYGHYHTIIFIIVLPDYYHTYCFRILLYALLFSQLIISIMTIMAIKNCYNTYNWYNSNNIYLITPAQKKRFMASHTGFNSLNALVYTWGSYCSKKIAKSRWWVHLHLGLHLQETGV